MALLAGNAPLPALLSANKGQGLQRLQRPAHASSSFLRPAARPLTVATAAANQSPETQIKEAEKRWNDQLAQGKVRNVTATQAADLVKEGWTLLDVRPKEEIAKAGLKGATEVPIFVVEESNSIDALLKKSSAFGMGGWWLGGTHMKSNPGFLREVQKRVPKDSNVVVTCQKGLRSLAAAEQLSNAGYGTLAWINGGLDTAGSSTLETSDGTDLRYGGIGGVSQLLGWTDVQREEDRAKGVDKGTIFVKLGIAVLAADALLFAYEHFTATGASS